MKLMAIAPFRPQSNYARACGLALLGATFSCHAMASARPEIVRAVMSQDAPFARYHGFSFGLDEQPPVGYEITARSLDAERSARQTVVAELVRKGYVQDDGKADFIVRLSSGTRVVSHSDMESHDAPSTEEANVTIDIYDTATGSQVWHGLAIADLDELQRSGSTVRGLVQGVFAQFPARRSPAPAMSVAETTTAPVGLAPERQ